jgi:excisionase family DNA binding protein
MSGKAMYTPKDAAAYIGVSDQTIYRWIDRDVFTGVIVRGIVKKRYLIPASEVERVKQLEHGLGNSNAHYVTAGETHVVGVEIRLSQFAP